MPQNEHIELHQKRHGKRFDTAGTWTCGSFLEKSIIMAYRPLQFAIAVAVRTKLSQYTRALPTSLMTKILTLNDFAERARKKEAREVHKRSTFAKKVRGLRAKLHNKKRFKEKVIASIFFLCKSRNPFRECSPSSRSGLLRSPKDPPCPF